jgi:hypothetical protein
MPTTRPADQELLTTLHLICTGTGQKFEYDVPHDAGTLKDLWDRRLNVSCPHCRAIDAFLFRAVYVDSIIEQPGPLVTVLGPSPACASR